MRRHVAAAFLDFDYRANSLSAAIDDAWDETVKDLHRASRQQIISSIEDEYGSRGLDQKIQDFTAIGPSVSSIIAHHNVLLRQVRSSFVSGSYYPALTGGCALGERILNHLMLDLRDDFRGRPEYKSVYSKSSFVDWEKTIDVLVAWGVLQLPAAEAFRALGKLRHRSLHFNPETPTRLRDDALQAIQHLGVVVQHQFSAFGALPWFIAGTPGVCFIKKEWEGHAFIRKYYLPLCPKVGYLFSWDTTEGGWRALDYKGYEGEREITDDEFRDLYNSRDPGKCASMALATTMRAPRAPEGDK